MKSMKQKHLLTAVCAIVMTCTAAVCPVQASAVQTDTTAYADAVVALVNEERAEAGLEPVYAVPVLNDAAKVRSSEIIGNFSHTRPDGRGCSTILNDNSIPWRTCGENIAYGYPTPEAVMDGWMHSDGHRANILGDFDYIGVGVVWENGTLYWTQVFTGGVELADAYLPGETVTPSVPDSQPTEPPTEAPSKPVTQPETKPETTPSSIPEVLLPFLPSDQNCTGGTCTDSTCSQNTLQQLLQNVLNGNGSVNGSCCENGNCLKDIIGLLKNNLCR
ncbi:MAG: hypothetical protein K2I93_02325 [Oscillospiraceae bacterium]|nr:hypothetical protein [Oscillospiraceae bacterium]